MPCAYAELHGEGKRLSVVCQLIVQKVGMRCGMSAIACECCRHASGDDTLINQKAKGHIRNLLISGNQPRFADTVNVPAMAARFIQMSTEVEREEVVAKAIEAQCISEERGGHDAKTIVKNLQELEKALKVTGVLEVLL